MSRAAHLPPVDLPTVDIAPLLGAARGDDAEDAARAIDLACRDTGFFAVTGHGVPPAAQVRLDRAARRFFALPEAGKTAIAMDHAGAAWRGWFPVGGELTSGRPDRKEGLYIGTEHAADHPRVRAGTPLHGANLFPTAVPELRVAVLEWLARMRPVADAVLRGMAIGLGLEAAWFEENLTGDPTELMRIFRYPPQPVDTADWGVGEHTDYGLVTLLAQDDSGGLEVRSADGTWGAVEPRPGQLVCNLGDMLERLTHGRYRSTPHRVRNTTVRDRLSFPYFFDPSWDARVPALPSAVSPSRPDAASRWDGADITAWEGTYGDYLTAKVAKVFPKLFGATGQSGSSSGTISP